MKDFALILTVSPLPRENSYGSIEIGFALSLNLFFFARQQLKVAAFVNVLSS